MYSDSTAGTADVGAAMRAAVDELDLAGLAALPVQPGTKRPAVQWKDLQGQRPTEEQLAAWFAPERLAAGVGVGAIMGTVSGGVELTEIEGRAAEQLPAIAEAMRAAGLALLWKRLQAGWLEISPSRGVHWLYRLELPTGEPFPGNTKIAQRPAGEDERGRPIVEVLAETRGEGGFCVLHPTPGSHHETGRPWVRVKGGPLFPAVLTLEERAAFHTVLRDVLDEMPEPPARSAARTDTAGRTDAYGDGESPVEHYNRVTDWETILVPNGWTHAYTKGNGERHWFRPGKDRGQISATTDRPNDDGASRLYVFSTSTDLEAEVPLTKAYVAAHYAGESMSALAGRLRREGYGDPLEGRPDVLDLTGLPRAGERHQAPREAHQDAADGEGGEEPHALSEREKLILLEMERLHVRAEAKRRLDAQECDAQAIPAPVRLDEFLAVPDEETAYRVEQLWPTGGRVMLAAQYKAGKTTLMGNLLRALVDGDDFLGEFSTAPVRDVVLIDNELDPRTVRRWLRAQGIRNQAAVRVLPIRGKVSSFDLLDEATRSAWADVIRGADVVILDCLRPVLDALGLDENHDAGRFLVAFDALISEAGAEEAALVHHMGHNGERSRGDSRILDWPDATWKLVREDSEDPSSPRYFSAFGRDVEHPETALQFDELSRHLSMGAGSRKDAKAEGALTDVLALLDRTSGGLSGRAIKDALLGESDWSRQQIEDAIKLGRKRREIFAQQGPRNSTIHTRNHPPKGSAHEL
ncbi:AAA family ATPase [Kocuria oceani]|uniref:AAA family ATPase n=1 Tax=Kocuria oceani TaxID=988827 RepID=A0ABV9THK1_9MICC|nr:AAA family ATPase [Kocuria oceani]